MKKSSKSKKLVKTRDYLMVKIIQGATKANVKTDKRKQLNKDKCRTKINEND